MRLYFVYHCYSKENGNDEAEWIDEKRELVAVFSTLEDANAFIKQQKSPEYYDEGWTTCQPGGPRTDDKSVACYRYFFVVEGHESGKIINDPYRKNIWYGQYRGCDERNPEIRQPDKEEIDKIMTALYSGQCVYLLPEWYIYLHGTIEENNGY